MRHAIEPAIPPKAHPPAASEAALRANFEESPVYAEIKAKGITSTNPRISGAFVIARNTAFTFKGGAVDVKKLGRELSVGYVLEGSVQRSGNRLRVNVQLIDAETGNHLWAERFDKPVADLFDMQDEIVSRLANTLNAQLVAAEARRAEGVLHPDAMDLYFQGTAWLNKGSNPETNSQARTFFERSLALDPQNIEALVGSAIVDIHSVIGSFTGDHIERLGAAEIAVTKALSLAPNHALAHNVLGYLYLFTNRVAQGIAECERALELDGNLADAHALVGVGKYFIGQGADTEAHVQEAFRRSPRDTYAYRWLMYVGVAKLWLGADAEAAAWLRRSIEANPNFPLAHFYLAVALAYLNELVEARAAAASGHRFE